MARNKANNAASRLNIKDKTVKTKKRLNKAKMLCGSEGRGLTVAVVGCSGRH